MHAIAVAPCCRTQLHLGVKAQLTGPGYQPEQLTADIVADVGLAVPVQARQFAGHPGPGRPALQLGGQRERGLPERHAIKNSRTERPARHRPPGLAQPGLVSPRQDDQQAGAVATVDAAFTGPWDLVTVTGAATTWYWL